MSCILRIVGKDLDPDLFVAETGLQPYKLFRRGEPRFRSKLKGKIQEFSGIAVEVSVADFDEYVSDQEGKLKSLGLHLLAEFPQYTDIKVQTYNDNF